MNEGMMSAGSTGEIIYSTEEHLEVDEFIDILVRSGLAERRPVSQPNVIRGMVEFASLMITARTGDGLLVGVARSVTDFSYCCYLSDLAVDRNWQRQGIGKELMRRTHVLSGGEDKVTMLLLSAPDGMAYYPKAGLEKLDNCFAIRRKG